jgi:hypothetical protein
VVEVVRAEQTAGRFDLAGRERRSEGIEDVIASHDGDGMRASEDDHKIPAVPGACPAALAVALAGRSPPVTATIPAHPPERP